MEREKQRLLLIEEYKAYISTLESKGVVFSSPFDDKELETLTDSDLKRLVGQARDLARTPVGP